MMGLLSSRFGHAVMNPWTWYGSLRSELPSQRLRAVLPRGRVSRIPPIMDIVTELFPPIEPGSGRDQLAGFECRDHRGAGDV